MIAVSAAKAAIALPSVFRLPALFRLCLLAALLAVPLCPAAAADVALRASWLPGRDGLDAAQIQAAPEALPFTAFDAQRLQVFPRQPFGAWLRLRPAAGEWPATALILSLPASPFGTFSLFDAQGRRLAQRSLDTAPSAALPAHGRLAFALPTPLEGALLLRLEPADVLSGPLSPRVQPLADYLRDDAAWLSLASACLAAMLVTALMALLFAAHLRDLAFAYYALYIGCYAFLQAAQSAYLVQPLHWLEGDALLFWGRLTTGLSVGFAGLFVVRFAALRRYAPRLWRPLLVLCAAVMTLSLLRMLPLAVLQPLLRAAINPLLIVISLWILLSSGYAAWRGSRYAGFFLAGWTPLLVTTGLSSAQTGGALASWTWLSDTGLSAGAYEAVLLMLGLADRALLLRRERDQAQRLAELDSLTLLLNRRAWERRLQELASVSRARGAALSVVFIDLDHFKKLNDALGHDAGDQALLAVAQALRAALRPRDVLGRYGGEEFVAVLPECPASGAMIIAERLRGAVRQLDLPVDRNGLLLSASIGVATRTADESVSAMIARADQAMYAAKRQGRDRVCLAGTAAT